MLFDDLPRGVVDRRAYLDRPPNAHWKPLNEISAADDLRFDPARPGQKVLLGALGSRLIGMADDRHMITVAGSRAGKGVSAIVPNLLTYQGSILAIDPKGELACITAEYRNRRLGQAVHVLDPFERVAPWAARYSASYNPMSILGADSKTVIEDAGLIADALIISSGGDTHWDDAARNLIEGLILHVATCEDHESRANLVTVRELLMEGADHGNKTGMDGLHLQMEEGAKVLRGSNEDVADAITFSASDFFDKPENERGSVLSTARRHTKFLDFAAIKGVLQRHSFDLTDLKTDRRGVTVYLCLPATRLSACSRWFRLFVNLALEAMERVPTAPPVPVLMVLDEFAILGHMKQIEDAAGQIAGFGVKLWPILQDLTQLKALYSERWETFMGNAGVLQFFGNNDVTTLEFIEKRLGQTTLQMEQVAHVAPAAKLKGETGKSMSLQTHSLITAEESSRYFSRDDIHGRQLIIRAGDNPMILQRVKYYEHPAFKGKWRDCRNLGND